MTISRRTLLRGAGASLALPWLEAMSSAKTQAPPVRMAVLYMPNGVNTKMWTPEGEGRDFSLSPTLAPLEPFQDQTLVLSNLWNAAANTGDGHYVKESSILTCTTISKTLGVDINMHGVSMDQLAASRVGKRTPIASLELGIEPESTGVDTNVGYTRVYGAHIAWSTPTTPLAREIEPRAVWERIFRATKPGGEKDKSDALLLDKVLGEAKRLRAEVGKADQKRIDEYLEVVRGLEERLARKTEPGQSDWAPQAEVTGEAPAANIDRQTKVHLMMDMIAVAFQSDVTRIVTLMFGNAVSNADFRWLEGVSNSHHELSHHENKPEKLHQYHLINRWYVGEYAYLLGRLREMKEGERTVLDNSMVLFCSALSDGNKHNPHRLPLVVAGGGGGRLAGGRHLVYTEDTPVANLYVSMLEAFGTPVDRFADSVGPLRGVLA